jgi:hypothetical protein
MNKAAFFRHCKDLAGDRSAGKWSAENLAGFFQHFRPDGQGLEALFADIPAGEEVLGRLRQVFQATCPPLQDSQQFDLYFIVRQPPPATEEQLVQWAAAQLANWRQMAVEIEEEEFINLLTPLPTVRISRVAEPAYDPNDTESLDVFINDVQTDWHGALEPICPHASWLREAFYYLGCDYYLARHLTWPWYRPASSIHEPYEPYFELWRHGAKLRCISPDAVTLYLPAANRS